MNDARLKGLIARLRNTLERQTLQHESTLRRAEERLSGLALAEDIIREVEGGGDPVRLKVAIDHIGAFIDARSNELLHILSYPAKEEP